MFSIVIIFVRLCQNEIASITSINSFCSSPTNSRLTEVLIRMHAKWCMSYSVKMSRQQMDVKCNWIRSLDIESQQYESIRHFVVHIGGITSSRINVGSRPLNAVWRDFDVRFLMVPDLDA